MSTTTVRGPSPFGFFVMLAVLMALRANACSATPTRTLTAANIVYASLLLNVVAP